MCDRLLKIELRAVQAVHHLLIGLLVTAPVWSWFLLPISTAVLITALAIWRILSNVVCPLTYLENCIRIKLHMTKITGFISFYYFKPFYRFLSKQGWNTQA